jgi:phosphopantetheinyl transferase (holo-ACP synthase)
MQKRLKGTKETVEKYEKTVPVLELLSKKYGVDASDIDALTKAMNDDDSYFEEEAMQKGISVEQLKEFRRMEKENAELRKMRDEQERKANADRIYAEWTKQAEATKLVYPNFNLENEVINNPQFVDLIRNNIDVRTAYEVTHKDDIIAGAMQFAAKEAEAKVTNRVIANGSRPNENGISSRGASQVKSDVSKLTKAERDDIARRVARGEKIDLSKGYYR